MKSIFLVAVIILSTANLAEKCSAPEPETAPDYVPESPIVHYRVTRLFQVDDDLVTHYYKMENQYEGFQSNIPDVGAPSDFPKLGDGTTSKLKNSLKVEYVGGNRSYSEKFKEIVFHLATRDTTFRNKAKGYGFVENDPNSVLNINWKDNLVSQFYSALYRQTESFDDNILTDGELVMGNTRSRYLKVMVVHGDSSLPGEGTGDWHGFSRAMGTSRNAEYIFVNSRYAVQAAFDEQLKALVDADLLYLGFEYRGEQSEYNFFLGTTELHEFSHILMGLDVDYGHHEGDGSNNFCIMTGLGDGRGSGRYHLTKMCSTWDCTNNPPSNDCNHWYWVRVNMKFDEPSLHDRN